ncbi:MAG: YfhO family protein [Tenericutes bacterium]|nr:YfhO family protein [Mycoplasmatota bacterium]
MKKLKKINKKDWINIIILVSIITIAIIFSINNKYIYGSELDWVNQHSVIPDYFRTLFYNNFDLLPDFALNLGSGVNIYNYGYYGFLNPIILFSYLLPFISMTTYIQIAMILVVYISVILFYYFLRIKFKENVSLLGSIIFATASPLLFHSHRHLMFMNYMPFLILALIGVDKYFKNDNKKLLSISVLLIILCSYYYSVGAIITIVIYGVYKYISLNKKITIKGFFKDGFRFLYPIIIGILMSSILLIPTVYVILTGRMTNIELVTLSDILIPKINVKFLLYNAYGIGLTSFSLISLLVLFMDKKRENKYLFYILSCLIVFPIIVYLLNGTMYIDAKVLIPMLPLYSYSIAYMFEMIFKKKVDIKKLFRYSVILLLIVFIGNSAYSNYFYLDYAVSLLLLYLLLFKFNLKKVFIVLITCILTIYSIFTNREDKFIKIDDYKDNLEIKELASKVNTIDRTSIIKNFGDNTNNIFCNLNMYQNYTYSSTNSSLYNKFVFDVFDREMQHRNRLILSANKNLMFLMFMNNRYIIGENVNIYGYNKIESYNNLGLYENNDVLPFMYVTSNTYNLSNYNKLSFPYNNEVILKNVVVSDGEKKDYSSKIKEVFLRRSDIKFVDTNIKIENNIIYSMKRNSKLVINVPEDAKGKILFVSFNVTNKQSCSIGDQAISINGDINKKTCSEWKYYNGNDSFTYVISDKNIDSVTVEFLKGEYHIEDLKLYYMSYDDIKNVNKSITKVNIDKAKGDYIYASVNNNEDGYFVTTLPYDKGYTVLVDGREVETEIVNKFALGFKLEKGKHNIEISYKSPFKNIGIILSIFGIVLFIFNNYKIKKFNK